MVNIKNEALFKSKLLNGISIFAGAGFSVLKAANGNGLPTGAELKKEVIECFHLSDVTEDDDLDYISEFCAESDYQRYLRERFTVTDYNPLYDALNCIRIKSFVTTNIDNIVRLVADNSTRYYLKNIREEGACANRANELIYVPLHGDVLDDSSKLYFGKFDLATVTQNNKDLFSAALGILSKSPILFWGYNFDDSGVLSVIKKMIDDNHSNIWVQILPGDEKNKRLFEKKGCNIIECDTEALLRWIRDNCKECKKKFSSVLEDPALQKYKVPSVTQVPNIPKKDYYQQGVTDWYPIIKRVPYEREIVSEAENAALENKNVIISGAHFSGKTTILMQLSKKIDSENILFVNEITKNEAEFILKKIGNIETWVLFNNCCSDIDAFVAFAKAGNIKLIGTADDYLLETVKHILSINVKYKVIDCSTITRSEAMNIYNSVPSGIRKTSFSYAQDPNEKYTMFEFISNNIEGAYTKKHISHIFEELKKHDRNVFITVIAASYFSQNNSAISYQTVANILNVNIYPEAVNVIKQASSYLRLFDIDFSQDEDQIDFYVLRSKIFIYTASKVLIEKYRNDYAQLVEAVIHNVNPYSILRYGSFRRKAFDSSLFRDLFSYEKAVELYNYLYERDENPYTLQQLALCQSLFGDHENAFNNIDKALSVKPGNFSFRNSQAIIMFEANHKSRAPESKVYLEKSMAILEECYTNDKRKLYHAQKYAEFAIVMAKEYGLNDYLSKANDWLLEMTNGGTTDSTKTKRLKERLSNMLSSI